MPSIQGYTKSRIKEIEDNSIISGAVVGSDLILQKYNGQTITAGPVVGSTGPTGPAGVSNGAFGRGVVATSSKTGVQTGITATPVDVTSLVVNFTGEVARRYKITAFLGVGSSVTGDSVNVYITDSSNNVIQMGICAIPNNGFNPSIMVEAYVTPGPGTKTYKVRAARGTGSGSVAVDAGTERLAYLTVEDIGTL